MKFALVNEQRREAQPDHSGSHENERGVPFYIGMGQGRRAWDTQSRHELWHYFVRTRLNGNFKVVILEDNHDETTASQRESAWIAQESETLVNWVSMGRQTDHAALERLHQLRDAPSRLRRALESAHT